MSLAVLEGQPVNEVPWPVWPVVSPSTMRMVETALRSSRWTVSGQSLSMPYFEQRLREAWAEFVGARFALPCSSGTAALSMALDALEIGPGDEVIVPGMTWVACPQSVYNSGARPILVDVDPETLSMDPHQVETVITAATRAILVVHAYAGCADINRLSILARKHNLRIIEDASQAHGAAIGGQRVGMFGDIAIFSTQQSKLLASGEGGLLTTQDSELFDRLQCARMDGRRLAGRVSPDNWMVLEGTGEWQGRNFNLPEFSCALLVGGIAELEELNMIRLEGLLALEEALNEVEGVRLRKPGHDVTSRVAWRATLMIDFNAFPGLTLRDLANRVTAETGLPIEPVDEPFNRNPLYQPLRVPRVGRREDAADFDPSQFDLPVAVREQARTLAFPHFALTAPPSQVVSIARAFQKVQMATALSKAGPRG